MDKRKTPQQDQAMTCKMLVENYRSGYWKVPSFQRKPLEWDKDRCIDFVSRLVGIVPPIGVIVVYELEDIDSRDMFILDGLQRISLLDDLMKNPERYGHAEEDVNYHLRRISMPCQFRIHATHQDAYDDFLHLNNSLLLTTYEKHLGTRAVLPEWNVFRPVEGRLHDYMDRIMDRHGVKRATAREPLSKIKRHNLGLFYRYATRFEGLERWNVTGNKGSRSKPLIEYRLVDRDGKYGSPDDAIVYWEIGRLDEALRAFERALDNDFGLIDQAWRESGAEPGRAPQGTAVRWLHEMLIHARNVGHSTATKQQFIKEFFYRAQGVAQVPYADGGAQRVTLGLGRLGRMNDMLAHCGITVNLGKAPESRKTETYAVKPGYDKGHFDPYSISGNGPTMAQPASENRAIGNRH